MKKKLLALFLAAAMVGTAAGCSQNGSSGTSSGGESGASQSSGESQEPSGEVVTLHCGGWGRVDTEHEAGVIGMAEAIGINVEFQKYPTDADFWNNLPAQIAAKTAPDFVVISNELYLPYIRDGMIVPLTQYIEDGTITCWDRVNQNAKDVWTVDGDIYAIPFYQTPAVFAINTDLWSEAGLTEADYPETWDDVLDACKVFKDTLGMTGLCVNTQEYHFTNYCLSFGGGWDLGKTIDTPENAAALQFIIDAYRQGYVVTPKELGVSYVIIGHSERRQYFGETDVTVNKRLKAAVAAGLTVILCVGEMLEDRENGVTDELVAMQTKIALGGVSREDLSKIIIAYEPVWAIGTGKTATADQANEVCAVIRATVEKLYDKEAADAVTVQYGGSMNAGNAAELLSKPDVDGGLIGGASLKAPDFAAIVEAASK